MSSSRASLITFAGRSAGALFPQHQPPAPENVRRVLVVRPAALGDVLLATPALAALRRGYPDATITVAVSKWFTSIVDGNPDVDEVLDCGRFGTPGRYGWGDVWRFARTIRKRQLDLAVVLDRSPKVAIAPWLARIPCRAGIDSSGRGFALNIRVPWGRPRHEAELMLDVVRALGVDTTGARMKFVPSDEHRRFAARVFEEWGLAGHYPVVIVHPGGASNPSMVMPAKRWPAPRFAALADRLVAGRGARIVVVGHGADAPLARQMRMAMRHPSIDLVGQTAVIGQLAALLERSHLYAGNDSAPMHLAVAVGTPVVGVFGPTDPAIYGPYNATGVGLVDQEACSQRRGFVPGPVTACPHCRCVELVSVDRAVAAASQLLATAPQRQHR